MAEKQIQLSKNEELCDVAKQVAALWMDFRNNLRKAFSNSEIAPDEERHFLDVKSHLSRLQRVLTQRLPEGSRWGSKRMSELMQQSISIATLRDMPMVDKKTLYEQWHGAYISLENLMGILDLMLEGYPVNFHATEKKSGNIKAQMNKERQGKAKKASGNVGLVIVSLVLIGIAVWYTWFRK